MKSREKKIFVIALIIGITLLTATKIEVYAANTITSQLATLTLDLGTETGVDQTLQLFFLVTFIAFIPSVLLMMTAFTRIIIVMHFIRAALGTQQMPPNQVLIGISLFLTFFIMGPTFEEINKDAIAPYTEGKINQEVFITNAMEPLREFMIRQTEEKEVVLFAKLDRGVYDTIEELPNRVLIPAFILGEITKAFKIAFIIYMPFIVIDMVVASILMAMGMMMLPPAMISLPFKLLFFILADGWVLLFENLILTFR